MENALLGQEIGYYQRIFGARKIEIIEFYDQKNNQNVNDYKLYDA